MRKIDLIVIHCSATCEDRPFTGQALEAAHRRRGFDGTGYHFYIRRDGQILTTRPVERAGAHARGYNATLSESPTKADWTTMGIPKTHARNGNATRSAYWSALC